MDQKARRRHVVPAFGEWNYYYGHHRTYDDGAPTGMVPVSAPAVAAAEWYAYGGAAEPEAEACSDVWFKYSPPPRRPTPKKARRPEGRVAPETAPYELGVGGKGRPQHAGRAARAYDAAVGVAMARSTPAKGGACRVPRRAIDADLYQVPPPEFVSHRPRRKRAVSSLWMGCLGLNCVA